MTFKSFLSAALIVLSFSACKDQVDDSDLYTFTGETAYSFLKGSEDYSAHPIKSVASLPKYINDT